MAGAVHPVLPGGMEQHRERDREKSMVIETVETEALSMLHEHIERTRSQRGRHKNIFRCQDTLSRAHFEYARVRTHAHTHTPQKDFV